MGAGSTNRDILPTLRSAGSRYGIDTSAWRFQDESAFDIARLANLPHAPNDTWGNLSLEDYRRFVADELRFQASLGAGAYLVPGLIPRDRSSDLSDIDRAAASVVEQVCFERPLPAIASISFHTQGLDVVRHRLDSLASMYSAVYLQATPINPYADSVDKLGNVIELFQHVQHQDRDAIAGRMGAISVLLRALGVAAADAGMAAGESFTLAGRLRSPKPPPDAEEAHARRTTPAAAISARSSGVSTRRSSTASRRPRRQMRCCAARPAAVSSRPTTGSAADANTRSLPG